MARSVTLLLTGAIAGGAAVWVNAALDKGAAGVNRPDPVSSVATIVPEREPVLESGVGNEPTSSFADARLAIYRQAAETDDVFDLESLIERAAAEPQSRLRDVRIEALLARLSELDPGYAVRLARELYLGTRVLVPLFENWARTDADAAIAELVGMSPPARQREIALAILGILGNDAESFERLAAALPEDDRASFRIDAIAERAYQDPSGALASAMALDNQLLRGLALSRVARAIVDIDPRTAMAGADLITDSEMRTAYSRNVLDAWAELDPEGAFAWFEAASTADVPEFTGAYRSLAAYDAERALALVGRLPPALRTTAQMMAMQGAAEGDPEFAIGLLDTLPPGMERDRMIQSVASAYGRRDPDQALAWARSLVPPAPQAVSSVIQGIAQVDIDRAIDLMLEEFDGNPGQGAASMRSSLTMLPLMMSLTGQRADFSRVADRLLGVNDPMMRSLLSSGISSWARSDPDSAVAWALDNAGSLDPAVFSNVARGLANTDMSRALATLDQLPPTQRGQWLEGVASELARQDLNGAVNLLERYRGQPGHDAAFATVAREMAGTNPEAAAGMLSNAPASAQASGAAMMVAMQWSGRDPRAAASWAQGLSDERARTQSMNVIATNWTQRDESAARQWLDGLARGAARDAALSGYMSSLAMSGRFDPALVDTFSTAQAGQQAVSSAVVAIGRTDPAQAERLLNTYITDEQIRRRTEEALARTGGAGSTPIVISNGAVFF